jgi:uncharacterized membrane protein
MDEKKKTVSLKTLSWLLKEIELWRTEGVVSPEQAGQLQSRYRTQYESQEKGRPDMMTIVISITGALLIGLGVILFIAYNWDKISREVHTGMILSAMVIAYLGGYFIREKYPAYRILGEAAIFLGAIFFGSGIWLIAQMYNINAHYPNGFLFWAIGAIAVSYVTQSVSVNMLASVLLATWTCTECFGFEHANLWYFPAVAIGIFPFIYQTKSRHALTVALSAMIIGFLGHIDSSSSNTFYFLLYQYIGLGCILFLAGMLHYQKDSDNVFFRIYTAMSLRILVVALFITTFYDMHKDIALHTEKIPLSSIWIEAGIVIIGAVFLFYNVMKLRSSNCIQDPWITGIVLGFPLVLLLATATPFLLKTHYSDTIALLLAVFWNIVYLVFALALLYIGQQNNKLSLLYTGSLVLLLLAVGRYFDLGYDRMERSVYFLIIGGLFIYYGIWLSKKRKEIQNSKHVPEDSNRGKENL